MTPAEIRALSVRQLVTAVQQQTITARHAYLAYYEIIEQREPELHCFAYYSHELALRAADQVDARIKAFSSLAEIEQRLPLAGVPIAVKDIFDTQHMPTSYGSPIYANHQPSRDAVCVAVAMEMGCVVVGKSHTTEFAYYTPSLTVNPWDAARSPGGSSSGSACAVAAGLLPIAFATQSVGSIVRPASFCGIAGFKPTYGTICCSGVNPLAHSLDTIGSLARTVDDAAYLVGCLTNRQTELRGLWPLGQLQRAPTFAICQTPHWAESASSELHTVFGKLSLDLASATNTQILNIDLPLDPFSLLSAALNSILAYEASHIHTTHYLHQRHLLSAKIVDLIERGRAITSTELVAAQQLRQTAHNALVAIFREYKLDALLVPSAPGVAPLRSTNTTGDPAFNRMWTFLNVPAVSVSGYKCMITGLPIGIQVVGLQYSDKQTLAAAGWLEEMIGKSTAETTSAHR